MENSLEQDLDVVSGRIAELEKSLVIIQDNMIVLSHQIKETQHYLVKLAKNQHEITKRVTQWPFIAVDSKMGDEEA
jgi:predicted  nucleic acid-binding Zn-ribbon protein